MMTKLELKMDGDGISDRILSTEQIAGIICIEFEDGATDKKVAKLLKRLLNYWDIDPVWVFDSVSIVDHEEGIMLLSVTASYNLNKTVENWEKFLADKKELEKQLLRFESVGFSQIFLQVPLFSVLDPSKQAAENP